MNVRFIDPKTGNTVYPEPLTPAVNATPGMATNVPPLGAPVVHPLLIGRPTLTWDVRVPIQAHAAHWNQPELDKLAESATHPPTTELSLQSPHLPWEIRVRPKAPNVFVTVYDLLATIQAALKPEITLQEWARFGRAGKRSVVAAKRIRIRECGPDEQVEEEFRHPRRIDVLRNLTLFAGLVPTPHCSFDLKFERRC